VCRGYPFGYSLWRLVTSISPGFILPSKAGSKKCDTLLFYCPTYKVSHKFKNKKKESGLHAKALKVLKNGDFECTYFGCFENKSKEIDQVTPHRRDIMTKVIIF
jgi:hypothetical protein